MKVDLTLNGKDKDNENVDFQLTKNSLEDENIKLTISYQEVTIKMEDLEKAIKYIKGTN